MQSIRVVLLVPIAPDAVRRAARRIRRLWLEWPPRNSDPLHRRLLIDGVPALSNWMTDDRGISPYRPRDSRCSTALVARAPTDARGSCPTTDWPSAMFRACTPTRVVPSQSAVDLQVRVQSPPRTPSLRPACAASPDTRRRSPPRPLRRLK